jgi:hypothetical protein
MFDELHSPPDETFSASLPEFRCSACGRPRTRRVHRVQVRASWRGANESICVECWTTICQWAAKFALQQQVLPLWSDPLK